MQTVYDALNKLKGSRFRSGFHLSEKDKKYIDEKGMDKIREHAEDFIRARLAPEYIENDGKQTPMRGHPVFCCAARVRLLLSGMPLQMV